MKTARVLVLPFLLLLSQCCYAAEVPKEAQEHTFVRIDLAATETALVKFFALKPDDQTGQLYVDVYTVDTITTIEGPAKTTAFTGEPGTYTVDVFGNNTAESFTCRIIAKKPQPIPIPNPQPKPDDNVTPQPTPTPVVVPDAVLNKLGIGEVAYREALNIGDKAKVAGMATYVGKIKNQVRGQGLTPTPAKAALRSVEGFQDWADACIAKAEAVANGRDGGGGTLSWSNYLWEMESGLLEAAK